MMLTLPSEGWRGWVGQGSPGLAGVRMQESKPLNVLGEQTWPGGAALDDPWWESLSQEASHQDQGVWVLNPHYFKIREADGIWATPVLAADDPGARGSAEERAADAPPQELRACLGARAPPGLLCSIPTSPSSRPGLLLFLCHLSCCTR